MNSTLYYALWSLKTRLVKGDLLGAIRTKRAAEILPQEQLAALQLAKLHALLRHAYDTTVFYRQYFDNAGATPGDIKTLQDFAGLPCVTKQDIRERIEDFVSSSYDPDSMNRIYSGGSTGVPTMVYHPGDLGTIMEAQEIVQRSWLGLRKGDKAVDLWGLNRSNIAYELARQNRSVWFFKNRILLDAFNLTERSLGEFAELIARFRPALLNGYTTAVVAFAEYLERKGIRIEGIRAVQTTAEMQTKEQRATIERIIGAPVFNLYGSTEISWIASECSAHDGLHVFEDSRIVQTEPVPGLPETGYLVITDLVNRGCPLIRYRNDDLGVLAHFPCSCGRSFARLQKLVGRVGDLFPLTDGRIVHGEFFTHVFYEFKDAVAQFQIHQIRKDHAKVKIVPHHSVQDAGAREALVQRLRDRFLEGTAGLINYEFEFVDEIPNEKSGKYRFTKSDVPI